MAPRSHGGGTYAESARKVDVLHGAEKGNGIGGASVSNLAPARDATLPHLNDAVGIGMSAKFSEEIVERKHTKE